MKCPVCPFSFARLVDAGNFHAYVCAECGWTRKTTDRRPGNRPADVCALCDQAVDAADRKIANYHLYVGPGWVHGGGRETIPIHRLCADAIRAFLRTGTMNNDDCSCPPAWVRTFDGKHMFGCQLYEAIKGSD